MGSRGMNNSLQTAPLYPTASAGDEASLQNATASAGENVLFPSSSQASRAVIHSARPATGEISPELVALISQTVQAALTAEQASSSAAPSTVPLPSSSAVIPATATPPCSVGVPASLPSLASSAESLLASGTGFNVQVVQGRPNPSLVVPTFVSTFAPPSYPLSSLALLPRMYTPRRAGRFALSPLVLSRCCRFFRTRVFSGPIQRAP